MKKLFILFSILFLNFYILSFQPTIAQISALKLQQVEQCNEGFILGTKVNTPVGLIEIQNLHIGDSVIGPHNEISTIRSISYQEVAEYIQIKTAHDFINAGSAQKFYSVSQNSWVNAENLKAGDCIASFCGKDCIVKEIGTIKEDALLYQLSTTNQIIIISEVQLVAHNATIALVPITIGCISALNPVAATIGATLALSAGALYVYQKMHKTLPQYKSEDAVEPGDLTLYEKQYYEERRDALLHLQNELQLIKNGLLALDTPSKSSFTGSFFKQIHYSPLAIKNVSFNEAKLNEQQKALARKKRESHLVKLEEDIIELQVQICFHFNELVVRVENAFAKYCQICSEGNVSANDWNMNLKNIPIDTAYTLFGKLISAQELLAIIESRISELELAIAYYRHLKKDSVIKKSTNIETALIKVVKFVDNAKKKVNTDTSILQRNKKIMFAFFQSKYAPVAGIEQHVLDQLNIQVQQEQAREFERAQHNYKQTPRHSAKLAQTSIAQHCPCGCGCEAFQCDCSCGCPCKKERKVNEITKQEFFNNPIIKANYEHYRNGIYKLKSRGVPIVKNAEYLQWDHLHNDVEIYSEGKKHMGSLDPHTLQIYKEPVEHRKFPKI